ncbi:MAG TPA: FAD-binding protein [Dehalococcoidia bacterium]|nr:FAD-binding protein [Dehalococcoidia bacterium]
MGLEEVKNIAAKCVHFGMCKIDFLGTGVCPSGIKHKYASYYPQGGMEIVNALANKLIPVTERLIDIARSCTLCGICDKQCYFVTELRPMKVMVALKEHVEAALQRNEPIESPAEDQVLRDLRGIVGEEWATNDPAILVTYSRDIGPVDPATLVSNSVDMRPVSYSGDISPCHLRHMPGYVVMPESTQEVAEVVKTANRHKIPFVPRGTGQNSHGLTLGEGIIIDLSRMKTLEVDPKNWTATVGAGVTSFEMQKEANKHRMRASVAEPAACVCANMIMTGIYGTLCHAYGYAGDNYVDAEIVAFDGRIFRTNDKHAPNVLKYSLPAPGTFAPLPGICTQITVRLYPIVEDEEGILVPFSDLHEALEMMREIARRRLGIVDSILGLEYFAPFISPTFQASEELRRFFTEEMEVKYLLMVIGDKYTVRTIKEMADVTVDQEMVRTIMLGLPKFYSDEGMELLCQLSGTEKPYKLLFKEETRPLVEMSLSPSPENIAAVVDEDLQDFFKKLYSKPEMTDLVWLNMYRILSSRIGRNYAYAPGFAFVSLDNLDKVVEICDMLKSIGDKYNLRGGLGVINPLDFGKRAQIEHVYYFDQTNNQERENAANALIESMNKINAFTREMKAPALVSIVFQGLCRSENLLYT